DLYNEHGIYIEKKLMKQLNDELLKVKEPFLNKIVKIVEKKGSYDFEARINKKNKKLLFFSWDFQ
ncbi:MAG: hypothetical protein ACK5HS_04600, partial [Mycoplasmatales bacterium]